MRRLGCALAVLVLVAGYASAGDEIFSDGFEWGSICAWSNPWYTDADGDTWGADDAFGVAVGCPAPAELAPRRGDCDDLEPLVHPFATEWCDFLDNDCDPATGDGAGEPWSGSDCDGADTDLCAEGVYTCTGGAQTCSDTSGNDLDQCNGVDDDCNPATPDGSDEPWFGAACDGPDSDLCEEGVFGCVDGSQACSDASGDDLDVCNGLDDDCDSASMDGDEDPLLGTVCDGPDTDLCPEGSLSCVATQLVCDDVTGDLLDLCNGLDDDCDPSTADGVHDPLVGIGCDGPDTDLCIEGVNECISGAIFCTDTTGSTVELCNGIDDDCDGTVDDGFILDDNPLCSSGTFYIGTVDGDQGAEVLSDSYYGEEWDEFRVVEDNSSIVYLSATVNLYSPPGTDYDLYVYCLSCGGSLAGSSTVRGLTGHYDTVTVRRDDSWGVADDFAVIVEIRYYNSTQCGYWQLQVTGNTAVYDETCPRP